ncbi:MAG: tRNA (guanosine(37)-N1)-methyltransferase TrmD [bacterium]|nr:tRNA (guanosine(37)-N1)-methyltransferase TrmD [bacterium]
MSSKIIFDILTIFPEAFESYLNASMIKRGQAKKLIDIHVHNLRKFTAGKHKKVDDRPYGGGPGMVLKIEPIVRAIDSILRNSKSKTLNSKQILNSKFKKSKTLIILFTAAGKQFNATMASDFAKKYDRIIMIAGHYEGVDERLARVLLQATSYKLQTISIGPYVLTGGELPAMVLVDAVSRHIPGFLGKEASLEEKRYGVGVPAYTRPEVFIYCGKKYSVPKLLLSGNHAIIEKWRRKTKKK